MLKIENTEVLGWEHAIRGMRNPMNSWEKSDSLFGAGVANCNECPNNETKCINDDYAQCISIGPNDHHLMAQLRNAGTDHRKFMRMITVYLDVTAPLYFWKEFDTYRVGVEKNSCSTMHKIHAKEFTLEDFSCEHLTAESITFGLEPIIDILNKNRELYLQWKNIDEEKKTLWWQMIQLLPSSYNQKRTVMLNYEVLANIYKSRRNHKLDEWHTLCDWIEELPYSELITGKEYEVEE